MKRRRFPYRRYSIGQPLWPLGGRLERPRPVLVVTLIGPLAAKADWALLDPGADDTVFPERFAAVIGIDLTNAPSGTASGVGQVTGVLRYAEVTMRLTDGVEFCEWIGRVGFTQLPLKRPLLGFAGVLQFFLAAFDGEREEAELTTNGLYPGN